MLFSLLMTSLSGLLLQKFICEYQGVFALFLPVFTGVTGISFGIYCLKDDSFTFIPIESFVSNVKLL